jgi:type I restriction enzyme R subunit
LDNTSDKIEGEDTIDTTNRGVKEPAIKEPGEPKKQKIKVKLRDGKTREIQHMVQTSFWSADGIPMSAQEFLEKMFGDLPDFFKSEDELRAIWSDPKTRKVFLDKIASLGYGKDQLEDLQKMIDAEDSDLYDVLAYVSFASTPISRKKRVDETKSTIYQELDKNAQEFISFVLEKYIDDGVEELDEQKLPDLLRLKYHAMTDAEQQLGNVNQIRGLFFGFQKFLYTKAVNQKQKVAV